MEVVTDQKYVPVPPYAGTWWPRALGLVLPGYLRKRYGLGRVEFRHVERLRGSIEAGHGVLLTPNHCRDEDPFVMGLLGREVGRPFHTVASAHLFMASRFQTFVLRRAGAFSIYREGMDKQAVTTSIEILEAARRPLVIFPEGHISRTNDRIAPMLEGTALIARQAAKRRAKATPAGRVVVHPVAIRYRYKFDVRVAAAAVLDEIETRLTWRVSRDVPLGERLVKVGSGLMALKEIQYLGAPRAGTLADRIEFLIDALLTPLEKEYLEGVGGGVGEGHAVARVKRLRSAILPDLIKGEISDVERERRWRQLADAYLAQQLYHYPPNYVTESSPEARIIETVERFEEDLTGRVRLHGPVEAEITVGEAIEVSTEREARAGTRGGTDPIMTEIDARLKGLLGIAGGEGGEGVA